MRRHRPILQTLRNVKPSEPVFVQDERRVARNRLESAFVSGWPKLRRLLDREIGLIGARPFALGLVPPDQFLVLAPRFAGRTRARSIIYNAPIARPDEAPAVT